MLYFHSCEMCVKVNYCGHNRQVDESLEETHR